MHQDSRETDCGEDAHAHRERHVRSLQSQRLRGESLADHGQRDGKIGDDEIRRADLGAPVGRSALGDGGEAAAKADPCPTPETTAATRSPGNDEIAVP